MLGRSSGAQQNVLQYDNGDRVERISRGGSLAGSGRNVRVIYDPVTGCVMKIGDKRSFWHDSHGRLVQLVAKDGGNGESMRISFHHDHMGRLSAWTESRNKVVRHLQKYALNLRYYQKSIYKVLIQFKLLPFYLRLQVGIMAYQILTVPSSNFSMPMFIIQTD